MRPTAKEHPPPLRPRNRRAVRRDKVGLLCTAIVKVDLLAGEAEGAAGIAHLPEGMRCGEFSFVPRRGAAAADDGYLVGFATHATTLHSFCLVCLPDVCCCCAACCRVNAHHPAR